jgi:cephalosporin hydroxylase
MASPTPLGRSLDMSLREWIEYYQRNIVTKQVNYRDVPNLEKRVRSLGDPRNRSRNATEIVIEIGCKFGGTTLWLSDLMKTVGSGSVISVDAPGGFLKRVGG